MREEGGEEEAVVARPESTKEEGNLLQEESKEEGAPLQEESKEEGNPLQEESKEEGEPSPSQRNGENDGVDGGKGEGQGRNVEEKVEKEDTSGEGVEGEGMEGEMEVVAASADAMDVL